MYGFILCRNVMETHIVQSILTLFSLLEKDQLTNLQTYQVQKTIYPVCMLLLKLALMNDFYSMWKLEDIIFKKNLLLLLFFQLSYYCFLFLKGVGIFHVTSTIILRYLCKSFQIQLFNSAIFYFFNFLN